MGLGIIHFVPVVAYLGFWVMCIVSLGGKPLYGLYYMMPFLPYRTLRDHFLDYPLGGNVVTVLVVCVILGAMIHGKRLPGSKLYAIWLFFGAYLYLSMWLGAALGNAPAPLWISDPNFATWKDYMLIPLIFMAAGMVVEDRKAVRTVLLLTAVSLFFIDRSFLLETLSRSWTTFDEDKRSAGPLGYGSNQTAAFLAQFAMLFWGLGQFLKRKKAKLLTYCLVATTLLATLYTFSRGAYLAVLVTVFVLGLLKDRKLLLIGAVFLLTWQTVVPTAVSQRVNMTQNANGKLEASAQERVNLWENAKSAIASDPIFGIGFGSYQLTSHVDGLRDTHNWYVKVMVETGAVGMLLVLFMLQQMVVLPYRLFRKAEDPLYRGLGLGVLLAVCSCLVANCFGDRWTYLEINGLLWVLVGACVRATKLSNAENATADVSEKRRELSAMPYPAYR